MRVMVTAARDWTDAEAIESDLLRIDTQARMRGDKVTLVEGGCKTGGDAIAKRFARGVLDWDVETFEADWNTHGKAAGPIRNQEMVDSKPDVCLAYPNLRSRGTWDAVRRAQRAKVPTHVFGASA